MRIDQLKPGQVREYVPQAIRKVVGSPEDRDALKLKGWTVLWMCVDGWMMEAPEAERETGRLKDQGDYMQVLRDA